MDPTPLHGKCAIVTGGSRGIGQGIAIELAKRGAAVLITYVSSPEGANKTVSTIEQAGGKALAVRSDSTQAQESADTIIAAALKFFGGHIDIIVNNAAEGTVIPLAKVDTETFDRIMHKNVLAPLLLVKAARPYLRNGARVVNISSIAARIASAESYVYGASKAALEAVTRSMAQELGHSLNGTANAVNPGPVSTDMWHNSDLRADMAAFEKIVAAQTPAGNRIGQVDDIAPIVAFLCDPSAKWVTGNVTCANGGLVLLLSVNEMPILQRRIGQRRYTVLIRDYDRPVLLTTE